MTNETTQTPVPGEVSPELPMTADIPATGSEPVVLAEPHASEVAVSMHGDESSDTGPVAETAEMSMQSVAETNATPALPPAAAPSHGTNWAWPIVTLIAIAAVVWVGKKLKANTAAFEKSAEDDLVDSILDVVAKGTSDRAALRQELADAVANGGTLRSDPLAAIMRIEESYEKQPSGRYLRRISLLRHKVGTTGALTKIENELAWEYIPEAIREQFIKTRQAKVVHLVYDRKGAGT